MSFFVGLITCAWCKLFGTTHDGCVHAEIEQKRLDKEWKKIKEEREEE